MAMICAPFLALLLMLLLLGLGQSFAAEPLTVDNNYRNMLVRLASNRPGGASPRLREGRVEVSFDFGRTWGTICSTTWSMREANVVCRQLGLGYASKASQGTEHGSRRKTPWAMVGTMCRGTERRLADCFRERRYPAACNATNQNVTIVACVDRAPDLEIGLVDIERSARLQSLPMTSLTCAMEENCLSADAYVIRRTNPRAERKLLRFSVKATNVGTAELSPYANYRDWTWHQCHNHYHSMNVFATFDVYNQRYEKVAQGHKASFCLMDSECRSGITPRHTCGNFSQGISVGCSDVYSHVLDCQWVDVTNLPVNRSYILRVALNPEYMIGEMTYENNGAECVLDYTGVSRTTKISNCKRSPLWFKL
ncbi:lysyl oxidase homolog 2 [Scaptodrosophila lebanonensis]|uniref:Lysyl oxidase homolog 2 n=1 Tax=Drosophila lebanonensis TaxID=7225 RepID=A0A6J2T6H1_DROLE|nr:lysyl oxidase homolog 2 [Scaptodrosophila lebanonensis]